MVKEVVWRNVGVDLARTVVDLLLNLLEPFLRDGGEVMSFGEILPDKPAVVLHTALLPRMVGFAEIALAFQQLVSQPVLCELKPIVIGNGVHFHSQQKSHDALEGSHAALVRHQIKQP